MNDLELAEKIVKAADEQCHWSTRMEMVQKLLAAHSRPPKDHIRLSDQAVEAFNRIKDLCSGDARPAWGDDLLSSGASRTTMTRVKILDLCDSALSAHQANTGTKP